MVLTVTGRRGRSGAWRSESSRARAAAARHPLVDLRRCRCAEVRGPEGRQLVAHDRRGPQLALLPGQLVSRPAGELPAAAPAPITGTDRPCPRAVRPEPPHPAARALV